MGRTSYFFLGMATQAFILVVLQAMGLMKPNISNQEIAGVLFLVLVVILRKK